jgi:Mitochondrial carrier protein
MASTDAPVTRILKSLGVSAASACIAEGVTLPLDTAKVRLQLQNRAIPGGASDGPLRTISKVYCNEGVGALFKVRQCNTALFTCMPVFVRGGMTP